MNRPPLGSPADLTNVCRALIASRTNSDALALAESARFDRATRILKAVVGGATLADVGDYTAAVSGFIESLRTEFVFDTLLAGGMKRLPMSTRAIVVVIGATGAATDQLAFKPVSGLDLSAADLQPYKAACIVILSDELARVLAQAGGDPMLTDELRAAVGGATDRRFLPAIAEGAVEVAASGAGSAVDIYADLAALHRAVPLGANSRPYFIMSPLTAGQLALKADADGQPAFPAMGMQGGEIGNTPVLTSDALASESEGATMMLVDASQIAGDAGTIVLQRASQATLQYDSEPASGAAGVVQSLWQQNQTALRAERFFSFKKLRDDCCAELRGLEVAS